MKIDILTEDNDLLIRGGDFVFGDGVREQAITIIMASKGDLRNAPTLGVNLNRFIGSSITDLALENIIRLELDKENIKIIDMEITRTNDDIDIKINVQDGADI